MYAQKRLRTVFREYSDRITNYITKKDSNGYTEADKIIQTVSDKLVNDFTVKIQAQSMASSSHISRQTNLLKEDILQDKATMANPLLGVLLERFPTVKRRLAKSPVAAEALIPMLPDLLAGIGKTPGAENNGQNGQTNFLKDLQNSA